MNRPLLLALALALVLPFAVGCASGPPGVGLFDGGGWTQGHVQQHPALSDDTAIVWWTRGIGPSRERIGALRAAHGDQRRPSDLAELAAHCRPLGGPSMAVSYAHLAHLLGVPGIPVEGQPIDFVELQGGRAEGGQFTRADAEAWGIDPLAPPTRSSGGQRIEQVLLVSPQQHADLASFVSPWRVVLVETIVYPDGALAGRALRTLTNGDDASRFVRF